MNLSQVFASLLAIAKADAAAKILPLLATFLNSVASNPTALNFAAQASILNVGIIGALPGIAQDELKALAGLVNNEITSLAAGAPKS